MPYSVASGKKSFLAAQKKPQNRNPILRMTMRRAKKIIVAIIGIR
jgi:hypothetical protein